MMISSLSLSLLTARRLETGEDLIFSKDDDTCVDFIAATTNLRAHVFGIEEKSRFEIQTMAGNIIPAIATTNAIVAGMIVLNAIKVLDGKLKDCKTVKRKRDWDMRTIAFPLHKEKGKATSFPSFI
jgi:ubiquitin-like 1-activating enzyme E1 B